MAEELVRNGFNVTVLTPYKPGQRRHEREVSFDLRQVAYPFVLPLFFTDRPFPYMYLVSWHPGYAVPIRRWLRTFDLVQFEHTPFGQLLRYLPPGLPIVYNAHNVEVDYVRQETSGEIARRLTYGRIRRLESNLVDRASLVLSCSEEESSRIVELYGVPKEKLRVVPNGVRRLSTPLESANSSWPTPLQRYPKRAIFSGSNVEHNRVAVGFILKHLAPRLKNECAFVIQGECGKSFRRDPGENVHIDAGWDRFEHYAAPGVVGLNPITQGAGTNLKLANYLAHGLPVLSTEFGVRGFADLVPYVYVEPLSGFSEALGRELKPRDASAPLRPLMWTHLVAGLRGTYLEMLGDAEPSNRKCGSRLSHLREFNPARQA